MSYAYDGNISAFRAARLVPGAVTLVRLLGVAFEVIVQAPDDPRWRQYLARRPGGPTDRWDWRADTFADLRNQLAYVAKGDKS